jgi:hypothetical protein
VKRNGFDFNTMTLVIHAHDCVDITIYITLIFNRLFGQTIGAGTGELSTTLVKGSVSVLNRMTLMVPARDCGDITV